MIGTKKERDICPGFCGYHLDRKIDALIRHTGLRIEAIDTAYRSVKEQMATAFKECCQELGGKDADKSAICRHIGYDSSGTKLPYRL